MRGIRRGSKRKTLIRPSATFSRGEKGTGEASSYFSPGGGAGIALNACLYKNGLYRWPGRILANLLRPDLPEGGDAG